MFSLRSYLASAEFLNLPDLRYALSVPGSRDALGQRCGRPGMRSARDAGDTIKQLNFRQERRVVRRGLRRMEMELINMDMKMISRRT